MRACVDLLHKTLGRLHRRIIVRTHLTPYCTTVVMADAAPSLDVLCNSGGYETGYLDGPMFGSLMCEVKCPCGRTFTNTRGFEDHVRAGWNANYAEYHGITPCTHYVCKRCPKCDSYTCRKYECIGEAGAVDELLKKHLQSVHTCTVCNACVPDKFECLKAHFVDAAFTPYTDGCDALISALEDAGAASSGGDNELAYFEAAGILLASHRCPKALADEPPCDVAEALWLAAAASSGRRRHRLHSVSPSMVTAAAEVLDVVQNVLPKFKTCSVCDCTVHQAHAEAHMRGHRAAAGHDARKVVFEGLYIDPMDTSMMAEYETALKHSPDQLLAWFDAQLLDCYDHTRSGTRADEFARMCRDLELTEADELWALEVVKRRWFSPRGRGFAMAMGRFSEAASASASACGIGS